jgi:hypothetical protein
LPTLFRTADLHPAVDLVDTLVGVDRDLPPPSVEPCSTMRLGCERIGARRGDYGAQFESRPSTGEEVERWACAFAEDVWLSTEVGSRWTARVSRSDDTLRCGDIQPAR